MGRRIGSLFSGAGGLDLAVQAVFGGEVVWHAEIDKAASKVLAYRFPGVPNLGDISAVDWADVPAVDVLCGGFPCQDVSAAGKRAGIKAGTRSGLWAVFADAIDALRPRWVVIENVRGLLSATAHRTVEDDESGGVESSTAALGDGAGRPVLRAAGAVLGDLAERGYDAQWATFAAASVGAPHRRERVFVLATTANSERERLSGSGRPSISSWASAVSRRSSRSVGESAGFVGGSDVAVSRDGDVALLPTPGTMDDREKRTTHAGGNLTLQGAVVGVNPVDVERHSRAGRSVGDGDVALLPTPTQSDGTGGGIRTGLSWEGTTKSTGDGGNSRLRDVAGLLGPLLPTPRSSDCFGAGQHGDGGMDLRTTISLLPTPNAQDGNGGGRYSSPGHQSTLPGEARLLCTPSAADGAGGHLNRSGDGCHEQLLPGQAREMSTSWGKYEPAIRRWESIVGPAPAPTEPNKNGNPKLSAAFSEWLMGWPQGWVTHPDIGISRNDQLRIIGNGVCPQQATLALRFLLAVSEVTA